MPVSNVNIETLIQGIQFSDPRLYQILLELNRGLGIVQEELFPLVRQSKQEPAKNPIPTVPLNFTFAFTPLTVRFFWTAPPGAFGYELREGPVWETAAFRLRTANLTADIDPLHVGAYTFLIKALNSDLEESLQNSGIVVSVPPIGNVAVTSEVIDNNVLLRWTLPSSTFQIKHYEVYKNNVLVGTVDGTFFSTFENVAGLYTYRIIPVNIVNDKGAPADITVKVLSPPDYALQSKIKSTLNGTRFNVGLNTAIPSLVVAWASQTWQQHFSTRSWNTIQDQINAGYDLYIQPTVVSGAYYEEVIDYGIVINNTIATVTWNETTIVPTVNTVVEMSTSTDGSSYTTPVDGASQFLPTVRYLKIRLKFTGTSDKALMELYNLEYFLSVKRENDGGEILADASHLTGTTVNFNKPFKDVESITCTVKSILAATSAGTEPFYVIFDFQDIPNPVSFKVYVFDSSGNRVTKWIDWKARGII